MTEKQMLINAIDKDIATLNHIRESMLHEAEATFDGFHVSGSPFLGCRLLQFHRRDKGNLELSPKALARGIGMDWKRDGQSGTWEGSLNADQTFKVVIHDAEQAFKPLERVDL